MISKLTLKQRQFWKHYCKTHNLSQSATAAGCKEKSPQNLCYYGNKLLKSLELSMSELLDAEGLSDQAMAKPLQDGLAATRPIVATWEGKITDRIDVEDHPTRLKATELIGRMKGVFIDKHEVSGAGGRDIILQVRTVPSKKGPKSIELDID